MRSLGGCELVQCIEELRDEVRRRAVIDLPEIAIDENVTPEGLSRCARAAHDFEDAVNSLLNEPWIPKTLPQITACLMAINENIRRTRLNIADALDVVLFEFRPDDVFRVWMACNFERLLGIQRDVLMDAAMKLAPAEWVH